MALIDGITAASSLAVLGDGTILHVERTSLRRWTLHHSAPDGAALGVIAHRSAVRDVVAHPADPAAGIASVLARGVMSTDFAGGALAPLADAADIAAVTVRGAVITAVTRGRTARQLHIDPMTGAVSDIGSAPSGVIDLAAHPTQPPIYALAGSSAQRRLFVLREGQPPQLVQIVPAATRIATIAAGDPRLVVGYDDGRTEILDPATAAHHVLDLGAGPVWGLAVRGTEVLVGTGGEVRAVPLVEAPGVDLDIAATHYLSSWTRVGVTTKGGVDFDQLAFLIDPPEGGLVSASRDITFDPAAPMCCSPSAAPSVRTGFSPSMPPPARCGEQRSSPSPTRGRMPTAPLWR